MFHLRCYERKYIIDTLASQLAHESLSSDPVGHNQYELLLTAPCDLIKVALFPVCSLV